MNVMINDTFNRLMDEIKTIKEHLKVSQNNLENLVNRSSDVNPFTKIDVSSIKAKISPIR